VNKGLKKTLLLTATAAAIAAGVLLAVSRTRLVEQVRRESARLLDREYIPNQHVDIDSCAAAAAADTLYKDFRKKYRYHYQTLAMASFADSSRMLLLSDLPPHFETDSVGAICQRFTHRTALHKHPIGYDGYTTDMVILLGNATRENCDNLIRQLSRQLFFSDYKPTAAALPIQEPRRHFAADNIDYQITLDEFNTWFMEEHEGFISLDDTAKVMAVADLMATHARGVFFSRQPGFVAWALAKNADIDAQKGDIRQFTLDADLILGAIADSTTLVVIGRERQSPLCELPPLQPESILLLASTTEKELSQSLDVNDLMAGKMVNGRDWCPTYLSRELENTEFGDLMTLTDVLLKDWSEHGTIQEAYYRYPEPGYYPFDRPLFRKLGLNELVYNWNTAGAMYAIDCDGYTLYTLGRTGSLPVSYFNSPERSQSVGYRYESQAYHYFATLGCTDLARVVQYTALYQLFIDNGISYSGNTYPSFPKNKPFLLYHPTIELLDTLRHLDSKTIAVVADSLSQRTFRGFLKEQVDKQLRDNEQKHHFTYTADNIDAIYSSVHHDTQTGMARSIQEVSTMLNALTAKDYQSLARYLAYPRGVALRDREGYNTLLRARRVNQLMSEMGKNNLDLLGMDLAKAKNFFAANLKGNSGRYLKTSSLIVTFNDMLTTGGHNLSSRINRVHSMSGYKQRRGNYTPTDYQRPTSSQPAQEKTTPSNDKSAAPAATPKKGSGNTHAAKSSKSAGTATAASNGKKKTTRTTTSVRPRNAVIPSAPRRTRGF